MLKKTSPEYREIDFREWPKFRIPADVKKVYQNNEHIVMVYENKRDPLGRTCSLALMRRNDGKPVLWADMQNCKDQIFGVAALGVQYLPPKKDLIDEAPMYWFYVEVPHV